jgi:2-oxoglutarate dehydrogenase complex dehydrogenase (E1) component-like enzyme
MNSGAYTFVEPHLTRILRETNRGTLAYVGRRALAMTAVGSSELHGK